jgi:prepilin-type N-terminal cleavage/methylation domain-containing protein
LVEVSLLNERFLGEKEMNKGFSVVEVIITVAVVGLLSVILMSKVFGIREAATTVKCLAEMDAFATEVNSLSLTGPAPTQKQIRDHSGWTKKFKNYWYLPNNKDFNKGHGNDLDGCDEENPGESSKGRTCIPMRFVIVCQHATHGNNSDAKYCFKVDGMPPQIVPYDQFRRTYIQDAKWWPGDDPGFDKWIGSTPKK